MAENIELNELDEGREEEAEEAEENNDADDDDEIRNNLLNTSILVPDGSNPDFIPNARQDAGAMKRAFTYDKKEFFKKALKVHLIK